MRLVVRRLVTFPFGAFGGQPVPFGTERFDTTTEAVVAFGRFGSYGDFVSRTLVRLDTGEVAQVTYGDQSPETARWLRSQLRRWTAMPNPTREMPWGTRWSDEETA
jgi:hypothetical protein